MYEIQKCMEIREGLCRYSIRKYSNEDQWDSNQELFRLCNQDAYDGRVIHNFGSFKVVEVYY